MQEVSKQTIKAILNKYDIVPQTSSKGQNFLIDASVLDQIMDAAQLKKTDVVLEIGPGLGMLTQMLAQQAHKVLAIELDNKLYGFLKNNLLAYYDNVRIIQCDALSKEAHEALTSWLKESKKQTEIPYKLVANIPYNITSKIIRHFLETTPQPTEIILMVQKEVAQRIMAGPGAMSLLSLSVQFYGKPKIEKVVSRKAFFPEPVVDSAILKISDIQKINEEKKEEARIFFKYARIGFSAKRKQLNKNLSSVLHIPQQTIKGILRDHGIAENARAQELTVEQWKDLSKKLEKTIGRL